jgi:hypothetical protein
VIITESVISTREPVNTSFGPADKSSMARNTLNVTAGTAVGLVLYALSLSCQVFSPCNRIRCGAGVVSQIPSYVLVALYSKTELGIVGGVAGESVTDVSAGSNT